ncbi:MAG TPA: hypothetical protein VHQ90_16505 [Thermoanaerobaculia bacterium]|nr:hypothetical protein [Thermoanaerobaculia bacterium]
MTHHKKPTGEIGTLSVPAASDADPFSRVKFPGSKAEIEGLILRVTLATLEKEGASLPWPARPVQNPENHFDFTIPESPPEYLDLIEVALLPSGTKYQGAQLVYNHGERADAVWTELTQKALSYGRPGGRRIHLLLYSTDFAFRLSEEVLLILSYYLRTSDRGLTTVTYAVPWDTELASVSVVHPRRVGDFDGFSLQRARARQSRIADLTSAVVDPNGGIRLSFPPVRRSGNW